MNIPKIQSASRTFMISGRVSADPTLFKFILQLYKWVGEGDMDTSSLRSVSILGFSSRDAFKRYALKLERCGIVHLQFSSDRVTSVKFTSAFINEASR